MSDHSKKIFENLGTRVAPIVLFASNSFQLLIYKSVFPVDSG